MRQWYQLNHSPLVKYYGLTLRYAVSSLVEHLIVEFQMLRQITLPLGKTSIKVEDREIRRASETLLQKPAGRLGRVTKAIEMAADIV